MSDLPQGPDWWRASDGLYYPPEAHPDYTAEPDATPEVPTGLVSGDLYDHDWSVDDEDEPPRRRLLPVLAIVAVFGLLAGVGIWYVLEGRDDDTTAAPTTTTADPTSPSTSEAVTTTTAPSDEVSPFDLEMSDCFDTMEVEDDEGLRVSMVKLIDCADPHQAEVVSIADLDAADDAEFPGDEARDTAAEELCTPVVEEFLGGPLAASDLVLVWLAPTAESWAEDGDREVVCVVAAPDGQFLARSMAGAVAAQTDGEPTETESTEGESTDAESEG